MKLITTLVFVLALSACSSADKPPPAADKSSTATTTTPAPKPATILDNQLKAIDKAKGVEAQLEQEKQATDRKIDETEGK